MEYKDDITEELRELNAHFLLRSHNHKVLKKPSANYASELYHKVSDKRQTKVIPLWSRPQVWGVAASLLLVVSSIFLIVNQNETTLDEITESDVYAYIIDSEDIYSEDLYYSSTIIDDITHNELGILDQSIIEYLDDHIEDIELTELNSY